RKMSAFNKNKDEMSDHSDDKYKDQTTENKEQDDSSDDVTKENEVTVTLNDIDGEEAAKATLSDVEDGVKIELTGDGLPEEKAKHAFHVHEKGICEPRDFESACGHYNPEDKNHGKTDKDGN